jgi:hypothetical protein
LWQKIKVEKKKTKLFTRENNFQARDGYEKYKAGE